MPRAAKPLMEVHIRNAKPALSEACLHDGAGLYLSIMPNGARWWRLKCYFAGKESRMDLGCYPEVGLAETRRRRAVAREQIRDGVDALQKKRDDRSTAIDAAANTFRVVANEWPDRRLGKGSKTIVEVTALKVRVRRRMSRDRFRQIFAPRSAIARPARPARTEYQPGNLG